MQNLTPTMTEPQTEADYEIAVKQMLAEIERLNQPMDNDRKEIERLRAETRALLSTLGVAV